jgi:hypothetical protein
MSRPTRIDIPSPTAPNFSQRMREAMMVYLGKQGNPLDRGITVRDLLSTGLAVIKPGMSLGGGSGTPPLNPNIPEDPPDLTPPPTPTGLVLTGGLSNFFIETDPPAFTMGHGYGRTNVYGIPYVSGPLPTFSDALPLGSFQGEVWSYATDPSTTWRVWVKWQTADGVESIAPAGGTNGMAVTTGQNVAKLVDAMTGPNLPFKEVTSPILLPDGTVVPVGVYISDAFIHRMQVQTAQIHDLAVTNAKVVSLSASKITAGSIAVGQYVRSSSYVPGVTGFTIEGGGNVEFNNAIVRGTIYAGAGTFAGDISAASGNFRGQITGGGFSGYAWPPAGQTGFYLGPGGLLLGNSNDGRYVQIDAAGNLYAPQFSIVNGAATFAGTLSVTGGGGGDYVQITSTQIVVVVGGVLRVRMGFW